MKQAHFLASFLLSILFLFLEFSFRQAPASSHTSGQASLGLLASGLQLLSMVRLLPPAWGSAQGSDGGHSHSQEWDDCREGFPLPPRAERKPENAAAFLLHPPWGANYRLAAHCTGECLGPATPHTRADHSASPGKGHKLGMWGGH